MKTTNVRVEYHLAEADRDLLRGFITAVDFLRGEIYLVPSHPAALMSVLLQVQVDALFPGLTSWGL